MGSTFKTFQNFVMDWRLGVCFNWTVNTQLQSVSLFNILKCKCTGTSSLLEVEHTKQSTARTRKFFTVCRFALFLRCDLLGGKWNQDWAREPPLTHTHAFLREERADVHRVAKSTQCLIGDGSMGGLYTNMPSIFEVYSWHRCIWVLIGLSSRWRHPYLINFECLSYLLYQEISRINTPNRMPESLSHLSK